MRNSRLLVFSLCFVLCSAVLYCGITAWREHNLNVLIRSYPGGLSEDEQNEYAEIAKKTTEEYLETLEFDYPFDDIFSDPLMVDYICSTHSRIQEYELHYYNDVLPSIVQKKQYKCSVTGFFHVYGELYSYEGLGYTAAMGFFNVANDLGPSDRFDSPVFNRMAAAISLWEAEGNTREGNWLDEFFKSAQYKTVVAETYDKVTALYEGESVDTVVEEIRAVPLEDSSNPLHHLKNHLLCDAQELAEAEYSSYQQHKKEGDFVLACIDAEVIHFLSKRVSLAQTLDPLHYDDLKWYSFFPNPYVDLIGILLGSLAFSAIITHVYWRTLPKE
jgi:hypothetical protein